MGSNEENNGQNRELTIGIRCKIIPTAYRNHRRRAKASEDYLVDQLFQKRCHSSVLSKLKEKKKGKRDLEIGPFRETLRREEGID